MTDPGPSPGDAAVRDGVTLRLLWPQWQRAGTSSVTDDVVGFTIAEFFPRQVMHLQQILNGEPSQPRSLAHGGRHAIRISAIRRDNPKSANKKSVPVDLPRTERVAASAH